MGKTPQRLNILVAQEWLNHPVFVKLTEMGHLVNAAPVADIILTESAHFWCEEMFDSKLIDVALKAARKVAKERKKMEKKDAS